jgi:hypothetical protein
VDAWPDVRDERAVDVETEHRNSGRPHSLGEVGGCVHAESPLVALRSFQCLDERRLAAERSDLAAHHDPRGGLGHARACGHVEDHVARIDPGAVGNFALVFADGRVIGVHDLVGRIAEFGPDRALVEIASTQARGVRRGSVVAPERHEKVVIVHSAQILDVDRLAVAVLIRARPIVTAVEQSLGRTPEHRLADPGDGMAVDGGVHQRPRKQQRFRRLDVALREHELAVDEPELANESAVVHGSVGNAGVVGVPDEVIHPVDIEFPRNELSESPLARDEARDPVGIEVVGREDLGDRTGREEFPDVVVELPGAAVDEGFEVVAVGAVADIVEQRGRADALGLATLDAEV